MNLMTEKCVYSPKETAVFEALFRLIREKHNFSAIKVQDIATEAGMGKGTLYEYFSSKEDILSSAILYALDSALSELDRASRQEDSFRHSLQHFFHAVCGGESSFTSLLTLVASLSSLQREEIHRKGQEHLNQAIARIQQVQRQMFQKGRENGEIDVQLTDAFCENVLLSAFTGQTAAHLFGLHSHCMTQYDPAFPVQMICRALRP